jgi:hypothetical protein
MRLSGTAETDPGYEGRCIPECLVRGTSSSLMQNDCQSSELCVPCYSPITGEDTGACRSGSDAPVDAAPGGFAQCGDQAGLCVPEALTGSAMLEQLECAAGELCAPRSSVVSPGSCFAHCTAFGGSGACVPAFVVGMANRALLQQDTCGTGELCAPCVSPLPPMMRTGACD